MKDRLKLIIKKIQTDSEITVCAGIMSSSEPWITLLRSYEQSDAIMSDKTRDIHIAYWEDELAGFVIINMNAAFGGYIQTVAVKEDQRNKGVGTELIYFAENLIFKHTPNVFICVSSFNPKARKLYKRLGFELIGELSDYFIKGHSEYILRKTKGPIADIYPSSQLHSLP